MGTQVLRDTQNHPCLLLSYYVLKMMGSVVNAHKVEF